MKKRQDDSSDAAAFEAEMADVVPLAPDPRGRVHPEPAVRATLPAPAPAPSAGDDLNDPDEDFAGPGVDRRTIRKLKRGEYAVRGRLDLHGLTVAAARASVGRFIDASWQSGHQCVCIVYGRGTHSEGNVSALKAPVRGCLRSHRAVLAYVDAPRSDGGAGAVYVLLRK